MVIGADLTHKVFFQSLSLDYNLIFLGLDLDLIFI